MQASRTGWNSRWTPWIFGGCAFFLLVGFYRPALEGGILWDDPAHITRPDLQAWAGLVRIWTDLGATQQYYPVLHSAFWLEHRLWGDATLGYHLVNVAWHTVSCVLLALVLERLWGRTVSAEALPRAAAAGPEGAIPDGAEWLAAALFAVHPVCVESVAWISEQKNTLSLAFYLLAALLYLDFHDTRRLRDYFAAGFFFLLAIGTKSVTSTLPAGLLVLLWWKQGRLRWRRDVAPLLPWFMVAGAAGAFTAWIERTLIGAQGAAFDLSFGERTLLAGRVIWFYLGKLFWPADLIFIYPHWDVQVASRGWIGYLSGVFLVTLGLWLLRKRMRGPLAGWLFFVGSLFPALGFFNVFPFQFSYVADHFQYLPALGIIVLVAVGVARAIARARGAGRFAATILGAAGLASLAVRTHSQSGEYRDSRTLYTTTLEKNPACWLAHNNLGIELLKTPDGVSSAILHYRAALEAQPKSAEAHNNLGNALLFQPGGAADAIAEFETALRLRPDFSEARLNLANTLAAMPERVSEALPLYAKALQQNPRNAEVHFCFANTLAKISGRREEAVKEFETALRLRPNYIEAAGNLAGLLAALPGHLNEAFAHYEDALRLAPNSAKTHYDYAFALASVRGREADAAAHYEEAIRLNPNYAEARNNLGILFARAGRLDLARHEWEAALKLNPAYEDPRRNLDLLRQREAER